MSHRPTASTITQEQLDALYARIAKQSHLLQELKRDNFQLRLDIVALLEGVTVSEVKPGEVREARTSVEDPRDAEVARLRAQVARVREFAELYAGSMQVVRAETARDLLALLDREAGARLVAQPDTNGPAG